MKIYTKTGDTGETSLFGGTRVPKNDARIEAYGTIDELNSTIGVARAAASPAHLPSRIDETLADVQADLFEIGAHLASPGTSRFPGVDVARIENLEHEIDAMEQELEPLKVFILPGGAPGAAALHISRTVCRRAERLVVGLVAAVNVAAVNDAAVNDETEATLSSIRYLNRLSDYLFVAARFANKEAGVEDVPWTRL